MLFSKGLCELVQLALFFGHGPSSVVKPSGASATEFTSLQAAVNSIGSTTEPTCIFLSSGIYNERVEIKVKADTLWINHGNTLGSQDAGSLDVRSAVNLKSNDFAAYNINFVNGYSWAATIASNGPGCITASSRTEPIDTSRYIINHSTITSTGTQDLTNKVYLGRPWRLNARVMYQYSTLTNIVRPEGYSPRA
ncbi:pectinesterase precursor [Fusarium coicis]|nr:pectinesterase precursor [Fusarium coicis]